MMGSQHLPLAQPSILSQVSSEIVDIASDVIRKTGNVATGTVVAALGAELAPMLIPAVMGPDMRDAVQIVAGVTSAMLTPTLTGHLCPRRDSRPRAQSHGNITLRRSNMMQLDDVPNVPDIQVAKIPPNSEDFSLNREATRRSLVAPVAPEVDGLKPDNRRSDNSKSVISENDKLRDELSKAKELLDKQEIDLEKKDIEITNIKYLREQAHIENVANDLLPSSDDGDQNNTPDRNGRQDAHGVVGSQSLEETFLTPARQLEWGYQLSPDAKSQFDPQSFADSLTEIIRSQTKMQIDTFAS
jgi:hypothetical protein